MDVVYVCRPGPNEELRYSLRSLVNLAHDRVWIVGGWPSWVSDVECVPVERVGTKYDTTTANLRAALDAGVSERFVLLHDDMFVMQPTERVPTLHLGTITDVAKSHGTMGYARMMIDLRDWLIENLATSEPLCYEHHAPMIFETHKLRQVLELDAPEPAATVHKRSLYGNWCHVGGVKVDDCKIGRPRQQTGGEPFLSTTDRTFRYGLVGERIRAAFSSPGPYEAASRLAVL